MDDRIIKLFKALSDSSRLDIVTSLMSGPMYVELLAQRLDVAPSTISFHLKKLEESGLVSSTREQYYVLYQLDTTLLDVSLKELVLAARTGDEQDRREQQYRQKILDTFFEYGKLKSLPVQQKKRRIVLEEIAGLFEVGKPYTERNVNLIIADVYDDFCTVRRDMISEGLMSRANGIYTRNPPGTSYPDQSQMDSHP